MGSLSEEQRNFAKAYRSMQLESTLFGMCIIQIKPQLEKVLNLPEGCLTKEIRLTQDLMDLFIQYQIPTDLISFEGEEGIPYSNSDKIQYVKQQAKVMADMIAAAKQKELDDARLKAKFDNPSPIEVDRDGFNLFDDYEIEKCEDFYAEEECCGAYMDDCDDYIDDGRIEFPGCSSGTRLTVCDAPSIPKPTPAPAKSEPVPEPVPKAEPVSKPKPEEKKPREFNLEKAEGSTVDFTKLPGILNENFDKLDSDAALHATILKTGDTWTKHFQATLLSSPETKQIVDQDQVTEKNKAFDLLDALTKSGALQIDCASFHVVVAATHCFDKTLLNTIVQKNVNPIEKVERSALIVSSTIHEQPPEVMIDPEHLDRIKKGPSAHLFC